MTTNKPEVKRYDCTSGGAQHCYGCYTMEETELGDYVEWEAYEALQAECEGLRKAAEVSAADASDAERDAWHERAVMVLEKKNEWADRARKAESERNYLITENEKLHKDAERYRWLRDHDRVSDKHEDGMGPPGTVGMVFISQGDGYAQAEEGDDLDAAIDAAMQADSPC